MSTLRRWTVVAGLVASAASVRAEELGVDAPSGSRFESAVNPAGDVDDYFVTAFEGRSIEGVLRLPPDSTLDPVVELVAPSGRVFAVDARFELPVDESGRWAVRVRGEGATIGDYEIRVRTSRAAAGAAAGLARDAGGELSATVPGAPGARISWTLSFRGGAPRFYSLADAAGRTVLADAAALRHQRRRISLRDFAVPERHGAGDYVVRFQDDALVPASNVRFRWRVRGARAPARRAHLDPREPIVLIGGVVPARGGHGTAVEVQTVFIVDANAPTGTPRVFIGPREVPDVVLDPNGTTLRFTLPPSVPLGAWDVTVQSTGGQRALREDAFTCVPPPAVTGLDPLVGSAAGGYEVTLAGRDFRPGSMAVRIAGEVVPVQVLEETPTAVRFVAPRANPGAAVFGVVDRETQLVSDYSAQSFVYSDSPTIGRLVPDLVPVLGGDEVFVQGIHFSGADTLLLDAPSGLPEEIAAERVSESVLRFVAPVRPRGAWRVRLRDGNGVVSPVNRALTYYTFEDATAAAGLPAAGGDPHDAWTSDLADFDGDGDLDLFLARRGAGPAGALSQTRVVRNDGGGRMTDVTAGPTGVMPAPAGGDDWRADRLRVVDVDQDDYPDLVLVTGDAAVPPAGRSHVRLLLSEPRQPLGDQHDRVFRDRTTDLMAPARRAVPWSGGGPWVADDWRGRDVWLGELDLSPGPPEILVTGDETHEELYVQCAPYCRSSTPYPVAYSFYWGGSRAFVWDPAARGGLGRYRFEHNFFPRASGVTVPQPMVGGGTTPACNAQSLCRRAFTPFTGRVLAVGFLDGDERPDVAVVSAQLPPGPFAAGVQVGLARFSPTAGSLLTDATAALSGLGGDLTGDAVAIGRTGFAEGTPRGVVALSRGVPGSDGRSLRLFAFRDLPEGAIPPGAFDDVTADAIATGAPDDGRADSLRFADLDGDGDQDLVLLAGGSSPAAGAGLRVLRNESDGVRIGLLRPTLAPLFGAVGEVHGAALCIGDVDGDGSPDLVATATSATAGESATRVIRLARSPSE